MDFDPLVKLLADGFFDEVLGPDGKIVPTEKTLKLVDEKFPATPAETKRRLAQAMTLMDFAHKLEREKN